MDQETRCIGHREQGLIELSGWLGGGLRLDVLRSVAGLRGSEDDWRRVPSGLSILIEAMHRDDVKEVKHMMRQKTK